MKEILLYVLCAIMTLAGFNAKSNSFNDGLIAYYPFAGNANDESKHGNDAVVNGAELTKDRFGNAGNAFSFDGIDDFITIPFNRSLLPDNDEKTYNFWFKFNERSPYNVFSIGNGDADYWGGQFRFELNSNGNMIALLHSYRGYGGPYVADYMSYKVENFDPYIYHLVTLRINRMDVDYFVDGCQVASRVWNLQYLPYNSNFNIEIGRMYNSACGGYCTDLYFGGILDEAGIYGRSLSGDEILSLYKGFGCMTNPSVVLSSTSATVGESITIKGKNFTPGGKAKITFSVNGISSSANISTNSQGGFVFNYVLPSLVSGANSVVTISAADSVSGLSTIPRSIIVTPQAGVSYLKIVSPATDASIEVTTRNTTITFQDLMVIKNNGVLYPSVANNPAYRRYSYTLEYTKGAGEQWHTINSDLSGIERKNNILTVNYSFQFADPDDQYRIRIIDNYNQSIIAISDYFAVKSNITNLNIVMIWDKSFAHTPNADVKGVAADGTARFFIKVGKKTPIGSAIKQVEINISDGSSSTSSLLGKVINCSNTGYSTQTNAANSISAISTTVDAEGAHIFCYVAPDDFCDATTPIFSLSQQRTVTARIKVTFNDQTTENVEQKIVVVRPPLIMAHGLASSASAWDNFRYDDASGSERFVNSNMWLQKQAITLDKSASYQTNALNLLNSNDKINSLQGNISALRDKGFACNRVDYVCHSMGGCVMRTALTVFKNKYLAINSNSNSYFRNYEKGFINKAITINTPHQGSPMADLISEYSPLLPIWSRTALMGWYSFQDLPMYVSFLQPIRPNDFLWKFQATPAVKDLQVSNEGIDLAETTIKNHLIASDIDLYNSSTAEVLANLDKYLELIDVLIEVMQEFGGLLPQVNNFLSGLEKLNKAARVFTFIEWYSAQNGFPNFLGDGDAIVPINSQLAGNLSSSTAISVFSSPSFMKSYDYCHTKIVEDTFVGNQVKFLLNSGINSAYFSDKIKQTEGVNSTLKKVKLTEPNFANVQNFQNFDTAKVKILAPFRNAIVYADSSINIMVHVKDTSGLSSIKTVFQTCNNYVKSKEEYQLYNLQISPDMPGNQTIYVIATYLINDSVKKWIDTLSVNVWLKSPPIAFSVHPQVVTINQNEKFRPTYFATYSNFLANIPFNDAKLLVAIDNQQILRYNTLEKCFETVKDSASSTFAVVTYQGLRDTIYIEVQESDKSDMNLTDIPVSSKINDQMALTMYPNPTKGHFTLKTDNEIGDPCNIEICSLAGNILLTKQIVKLSVGYYHMDISHLPAGLYIVKLSGEKQVVVGRILKQ